MTMNIVDLAILLLAAAAVGLAGWNRHVIRDRRLILSAVRNALSARAPFRIGVLAGIAYLALFLIPGGRGGRVHILFGRIVWNTSPGEMAVGILLAVLVMLSMSLFVYAASLPGEKRPGSHNGYGLAGSMLAALAAFCP